MKLVLVALTLCFAKALGQCPKGFSPYGGSCYFFNPNKMRFFDADRYCTSLVGVPYKSSAHLVSIESYGEEQFIINSVKSNRDIRGRDLWMGGTQIDSSRGWVWTRTNQKFTYANWDGSPGRAYCGYMNEYENYKWSDSDCGNRKSSVCEYTPRRAHEIEDTKEEADTQARCATGFVEYGGHCYNFVPSGLDWYNADAFCTFLYPGTNYRVHLAAIESSGEQNFIANTLKQNSRYNSRNYWVSANNMERGRGWHWAATNNDVTFTSWAPNQPDNSGKCVMLYKSRDYRWDDYTCTDKNAGSRGIGFVCEYDPRNLE